MKEWMNAEVAVLDLSETAQGGKTLTEIDYSWNDENGLAHSRFAADAS